MVEKSRFSGYPHSTLDFSTILSYPWLCLSKLGRFVIIIVLCVRVCVTFAVALIYMFSLVCEVSSS